MTSPALHICTTDSEEVRTKTLQQSLPQVSKKKKRRPSVRPAKAKEVQGRKRCGVEKKTLEVEVLRTSSSVAKKRRQHGMCAENDKERRMRKRTGVSGGQDGTKRDGKKEKVVSQTPF